jgi:hypothetical protein
VEAFIPRVVYDERCEVVNNGQTTGEELIVVSILDTERCNLITFLTSENSGSQPSPLFIDLRYVWFPGGESFWKFILHSSSGDNMDIAGR